MLLLTDRPKEALRLKQAIGDVEPCTVVTLTEPPGTPSHHAALICDVALDSPAAVAAARTVLARHRGASRAPLLHLSRRHGDAALAQARAIDATATLSHTASHAQILFTLRRMIDAVQGAGGRGAVAVDPAVAAEMLAAGAAFSDLFDAARQTRPVTAESLEQGGYAVMAAVGGGRIGAWLDMVRNYDDVTYQHCLLVAGLAAAFAIRLGLSLKGQRLIVQAALAHDIGKASVPQSILNKPGPLSEAEAAVIRTHPTVGHDLLARQGGFNPQLLDIVLHHHEYLDGSGYPHGLSGGAVSPLVRLVTICDIYAALIERRSYKAAMSPEAALAHLVGMGDKLDASLLKAFHRVVEGG